MAEKLVSLDEFISLRQHHPMIDTRSEGEFAQSHIPASHNLPILTNAERVIVGTLYKQKGSQQAILKGFELVGPRFHEIQKHALKQFPEKKILTYCWRGGMRSQILSWILEMVGFEVFRLKGGYKTYRTFTFDFVRKDWKFLMLAGRTGTGKTRLLKGLEAKGDQIIDLEGLANHKGSSFGGIGQEPQPSVEQFENLLAEALNMLNPKKLIWVENESRRIGRVMLPDHFYEQMLTAPLLSISKKLEERIHLIAEEYGDLDNEELIGAVTRLRKKLGGLRTKEAIEAIISGQKETWIELVLDYYDKAYDFDLNIHQKDQIQYMNLEEINHEESITKLLDARKQIIGKIS